MWKLFDKSSRFYNITLLILFIQDCFCPFGMNIGDNFQPVVVSHLLSFCKYYFIIDLSHVCNMFIHKCFSKKMFKNICI